VQDVCIDYRKLKTLPSGNLKEASSILFDSPIDFLHACSIAFDRIRVLILNKTKKRIIARFFNTDCLIPIGDLKSNLINHYVSIKGVVLRTTSVRLLAISMNFTCLDCKGVINKKFNDGLYVPPSKCDNSLCKSRNFQPEKSTAKTILYQRVRIQEIDDDPNQVNTGRVPRTIDCELKETSVNSVISGDIVVISGVLKTEAANDAEGSRGGQGNFKNKIKGLFISYIDVNSIVNIRDRQKQGVIKEEDDTFTESDLRFIAKLADTPNIFYVLIESLCPAIYGHELVKAGLILAILGGSNIEDKKSGSGHKGAHGRSRTSLRPDCHVLLIGDPGLGKSQLLKFVVNIAPRAVYVCGNAASNAGLTVTLQKDATTGESALEAGALVLSDQGVCCIDEFDKMTSEHLALLEAMEQQTVSIAKSGVLCSLSTRTTIIASANPIGGHYK
jgi:DNA helicase MCM8